MVTRTLALGVLLAAFLGTALAGASIQTTANASVTNRGLVIGPNRFFPVMLIDQCTASDVANGKALGINLFLNESCSGLAPSQQLALLQGGGLEVLPIEARRTRGAGLVGWTYPDEPDNNGWTPASLAKAHPYPRGNADGLVTFVTTTGRFFRQAPYGSTKVPLAQYAGFARLADVAGFDLYPLNACQSDLTAVYDAQRAFNRLAGSTPTFQWIETGPIRSTYCGGFTMTPAAAERRGMARGHRRSARDRVLHAHLVARSQSIRRRSCAAAGHEADQQPARHGQAWPPRVDSSSRVPTVRLSSSLRARAAAGPMSSRSTPFSRRTKCRSTFPSFTMGR